MNTALVLNLAGFILLLCSVFMLLPVGVSLLNGGGDLYALGLSAAITFLAGLLLFFLTRREKKTELKHRDGFAAVTFSWVLMALFGGLPYMLSGVCPSLTDAYFEAMSGFTTTGSSVLSHLEDVPKGIMFWRCLTQWMGGMGIIVFSLAILPMLGAGGMQLFKAEVPEIAVEKLRPRIIDMAKSLWSIYAGFTAVLIILLVMAGMTWFDAICHSFTTMATGGFSTKSASVAYFNSGLIDAIITLFMFIAGTNFSLHFYAIRGNFSHFLKSSEFRFYLSVTLAATGIVIISIMQPGETPVLESIRYASFQVVSIMTTTGYATADYELWPVLCHMLLITLMFLGGMVGSTGGGMKQVRVLLMFKQAYRELYHLVHPRAMTVLKLDNKNVPKETLGGIWGFLFLFILIAVLGTLLLTGMGVDIVTSASTVISSISNVGPALGAAGPTENYASIPPAGKWVLSFCMLVGRLEIYTVILLFIPIFWEK